MRDFNSRRVLFSTDILLDAADESRPGSDDACRALKHCNGGGDMGFVTPVSLADAHLVLEKRYGEEWARAAVAGLLELLVVLPLDGEATLMASQSDEPDFGNGLVRAAAELNGVDFILTHDKQAFRTSRVRALTCAEYLEIAAAEDGLPHKKAACGRKHKDGNRE